MPLKNTSMRYGAISQSIHWLTVVLVIVLLLTGNFGHVEADEPQSALYMWHGSLGVLVLLLVVARVLWRFASPPPELPASMSAAARWLAKLFHVSFYALLVALPVTGWLVASKEGSPVNFFGVTSLPRWEFQVTAAPGPQPAAVDEERDERREGPPGKKHEENIFEELHEVLGNVLLVLAILHLLAGLKHHFIDRDDVLKRMLPESGTK